MATPTHKSATAVTLAPLAERSPFERFVQKYWIHGAVLFALVSGWILFSHQQKEKQRRARDESWNKVSERTVPDAASRLPGADAAVFESLSSELSSTDAGPWMLWLQARALASHRDYAAADGILAEIKTKHPTHFLCSTTWTVGGKATSMVDAWRASLSARAEFEKQYPGIFANPPAAVDAPRVRIKTDLGDIVVALFPDRAPRHVENFLDAVSSGYYIGVKFHHIDPLVGVDGGDPNSKDAAQVASWGQGGADRTLPKIDSGLFHFAGSLSAAEGALPAESLGSRFTLLTEDHHEWDDTRVVFGVVEQGLDVVRAIAAAAQSQDAPGRPASPVGIVAISRE